MLVRIHKLKFPTRNWPNCDIENFGNKKKEKPEHVKQITVGSVRTVFLFAALNTFLLMKTSENTRSVGKSSKTQSAEKPLKKGHFDLPSTFADKN